LHYQRFALRRAAIVLAFHCFRQTIGGLRERCGKRFVLLFE